MKSIIPLGEEAGRTLVAFMTMLDVLDSYTLNHKDKYKFSGQIGFNTKTIVADTILELSNLIGEWFQTISPDTWQRYSYMLISK